MQRTTEHLTDTEKLQRIREQRREAARRYRQRHPDRVAATTARYWQRRMVKMQQAQGAENDQEGG